MPCNCSWIREGRITGSTLFHALSGCDRPTVSAFHHSIELGREQHVLFGPVCLYCHRDFCSVVPFAEPGIRPRLRANRKIMLFCCISVRQHTTMWMKPGSYYSLTSHKPYYAKYTLTSDALKQHVKKGTLSSMAHLGTVTYRARFMGLGESRWWNSLDPVLDHSSRGSWSLSAAVKMWM